MQNLIETRTRIIWCILQRSICLGHAGNAPASHSCKECVLLLYEGPMKETTKTIIDLRISGSTYSEIAILTGLSKANISFVCNKYILDNRERIQKPKTKGCYQSRRDKWKSKREARIVYWTQQLSSLDISMVSYMSGLYDGEGCHTASTFSISNSDKNIILFCFKFFQLLGLATSCSLTIHKTHNETDCLNYWRPIHISSVYKKDDRNQKLNNNFRENYGTIRILVKRPLGLFEALRTFSFSHRTN